jgi:O-antigen ligase
MIYILLFTLSRGAYLGILIAYLSLIFLSKKGRFALVMVALLATVLLPTFIPIEVVNRIKHTFIPGREFEIMGTPITLDVSVSDRVLQINEVLTQWVKSPLFGYGITGLGFKEGQYVRLLGEIGIVGLVIFFWLIFRLLKNILKSYQTTEDDFAKGISLGLLVSLIGLLFHSWSANVFIIVRIMEPFWFLAALVISLPELSTKETLS